MPANDRAALVETLIFSLDKPDASIDAEWLRVAEDRLAAYHAGELEAVDKRVGSGLTFDIFSDVHN